MSAIARAERYAGQDFPCYGAQLVTYGVTSFWAPWWFNGLVVRWGPAQTRKDEAELVALEMVAIGARQP